MCNAFFVVCGGRALLPHAVPRCPGAPVPGCRSPSSFPSSLSPSPVSPVSPFSLSSVPLSSVPSSVVFVVPSRPPLVLVVVAVYIAYRRGRGGVVGPSLVPWCRCLVALTTTTSPT